MKTSNQTTTPPLTANLPIKEHLKQRMLDRYDLQEIFCVTRNTINNWCRAGILPFLKIGRKRFFDTRDIEELIEKRRQVTVPAEWQKEKKRGLKNQYRCSGSTQQKNQIQPGKAT